jgi:hypothetical protein
MKEKDCIQARRKDNQSRQAEVFTGGAVACWKALYVPDGLTKEGQSLARSHGFHWRWQVGRLHVPSGWLTDRYVSQWSNFDSDQPDSFSLAEFKTVVQKLHFGSEKIILITLRIID